MPLSYIDEEAKDSGGEQLCVRDQLVPYRLTEHVSAEQDAADAIDAAILASQLEAAQRAQQTSFVKVIRGLWWALVVLVVLGLAGLLIDDLASRLDEPYTLCRENAGGVMECQDVEPEE